MFQGVGQQFDASDNQLVGVVFAGQVKIMGDLQVAGRIGLMLAQIGGHSVTAHSDQGKDRQTCEER